MKKSKGVTILRKLTLPCVIVCGLPWQSEPDKETV